jgi:phosphoribosyl 1,2-cyclic phosphate phosphodiesterase
MISAGWGACDPANPKNRRMRPSILVEERGKRILIDTSPDLREQLLLAEVSHLDAVLYTHAHADHLHGIDDLREVNRAMRSSLPVYGTRQTLDEIAARFGYVFTPLDPKADVIYKPWLVPNAIEGGFTISDIAVTAIDQDHGYSRTTGFRIGDFAYSTDLTDMPDGSFAQLEGLELWVVGCLQDSPHYTHAHVDKALAWRDRVGAKRMVITHMSPKLDYAKLQAALPANVEPGYDGMILTI